MCGQTEAIVVHEIKPWMHEDFGNNTYRVVFKLCESALFDVTHQGQLQLCGNSAIEVHKKF